MREPALDFTEFWKRVTSHARCFFQSSLPEEIAELMPASRLAPSEYQTLNDYFFRATEENCFNMLLWIVHGLFGVGKPALPYEEIPQAGLYVGGEISGAEAEKDYLRQACETKNPVIGMLIHRSYIQSGNTSAVDALIAALEKQGAFVLPVFSSLSSDSANAESGVRFALERYFRPGGKEILNCIVVTTGFSLTHIGYPDGGGNEFRSSVFETWDVPVLQAMATRFTAEQYAEKTEGIDPMSLTSNVFQPEMDGQVISVPYAMCAQRDCEGISRRMWEPMEERIAHLARLAMNFASLTRKKNSEKKVAILFHNMPGNHNIGRGAGLDTFASVQKLLTRMREEGYALETEYADGQALAEAVLGALTNNTAWISSEEAVRRAADRVFFWQMHRNGMMALGAENRKALLKDWGEFPGNVMVEGQELLIPGILNGNVFIGFSRRVRSASRRNGFTTTRYSRRLTATSVIIAGSRTRLARMQSSTLARMARWNGAGEGGWAVSGLLSGHLHGVPA